jgi:hypothetical protein
MTLNYVVSAIPLGLSVIAAIQTITSSKTTSPQYVHVKLDISTQLFRMCVVMNHVGTVKLLIRIYV